MIADPVPRSGELGCGKTPISNYIQSRESSHETERTPEKNNVSKKALIGWGRLALVIALLLFLPAWSLRFWQAWFYWMEFCGAVLIITAYFLKHDKNLVERRLRAGPGAETTTSQKIIQTVGGLFFCSLLVVPGFDHRFQWSGVPLRGVLIGHALVIASFVIVFVVFKENSYAASTVTAEADQQVISTGPYSFVRHPMYAGRVLTFMATPLALGSWWAFLVCIPLCGVVAVRLLNEEQYLSGRLPGYAAYRARVRYRLFPFFW